MIAKSMRKHVMLVVGALLVSLLVLGSIDLAQAGRRCGGRIQYGAVVHDTIRGKGHRCQYKLKSEVGDIVTISMIRRSTRLDPYLMLYDPYGILVRSDNDSGGDKNSLIEGYRMQRRGTYTIEAASYQDGTYGPFWIYLQLE